jgi:putative ATPase
MMANSAFDAVTKIGWPEGRLVLAQCVIYLASSPKGNGSYMAINKAQALVKETGNLPVPLPLRNAPTKLMKDLGYGENYKYSHEGANNFVAQEFFPEELSGTSFYQSGSSNREKDIEATIKNLWGDKYK